MVTLGCSPSTATLVAKEIDDWLVSVWVSTNLFGWPQGNSMFGNLAFYNPLGYTFPSFVHVSLVVSLDALMNVPPSISRFHCTWPFWQLHQPWISPNEKLNLFIAQQLIQVWMIQSLCGLLTLLPAKSIAMEGIASRGLHHRTS